MSEAAAERIEGGEGGSSTDEGEKDERGEKAHSCCDRAPRDLNAEARTAAVGSIRAEEGEG